MIARRLRRLRRFFTMRNRGSMKFTMRNRGSMKFTMRNRGSMKNI